MNHFLSHDAEALAIVGDLSGAWDIGAWDIGDIGYRIDIGYRGQASILDSNRSLS